jgi:hypothetical protein
MMAYDATGGPPPTVGLAPHLMTARELREKLEELFGWLLMAEDAPAPDHRAIDRVRDAANSLLRERRLRHSDESAPRGG